MVLARKNRDEDHTTGNGSYMFVQSSSYGTHSSFMLEKPVAEHLDVAQFYYSMWGYDMGSLAFQTYDDTAWTTQWSRSGNQGSEWYESCNFSGTKLPLLLFLTLLFFLNI